MSPDEAGLRLEAARRKFASARDMLELGHHDDAASRAYYAMFHAAHALVSQAGDPPRTHRGLLHVLVEDLTGPDLLAQEQVQHLAEAQRMREISDYDPSFVPTEEEARVLVEEARKFVDRVDEVLTHST